MKASVFFSGFNWNGFITLPPFLDSSAILPRSEKSMQKSRRNTGGPLTDPQSVQPFGIGLHIGFAHVLFQGSGRNLVLLGGQQGIGELLHTLHVFVVLRGGRLRLELFAKRLSDFRRDIGRKQERRIMARCEPYHMYNMSSLIYLYKEETKLSK